MAEHAGGRLADNDAVAPDRFVVVEERVGVVERELDETCTQARIALPRQGVAADESFGFVPRDGEPESGFQRSGVRCDVVAPVAVALLHPQRVERVVTGERQVV